jgi:hypothetical protein
MSFIGLFMYLFLTYLFFILSDGYSHAIYGHPIRWLQPRHLWSSYPMATATPFMVILSDGYSHKIVLNVMA